MKFKNFYLAQNFIHRVVSAVYEMMGNETSNIMKAQELFRKMDQNSDGLVSQVLISVIVVLSPSGNVFLG